MRGLTAKELHARLCQGLRTKDRALASRAVTEMKRRGIKLDTPTYWWIRGTMAEIIGEKPGGPGVLHEDQVQS